METYIYIAITGFSCFLLGYILGAFRTKKNLSENKQSNHITTIDSQSEPFSNKNLIPTSKVRAVQTRGRMGSSIEANSNEGIFKGIKSKNKKTLPYLNFSRIGVASEAEKDDLKNIDGIGPFIEQKLNHIGIFTYSQISKLSDHEIEAVTQLIEFFPGRIKRDNWKQQASKLLKQPNTEF
ncbi:hypothetical protein [Ascidiimonas sp. W6]|uniref:hypothetical protein n=1 Tax=Ascidiimonas meishanensis TaxID=3128903 RepID=UPI0030ED9986